MKNSTLKNIGVFSTALFATASAVYMYSPVIGSHADSSATADINLTVGEVMSLTLSTDALNLSTNPNSFVSGVVSATTSTNSQYGYTLTLEDVDNSSDMTHTNSNINTVVTSNFSGKKTSSEMESNTWGFSLNTTDFYKVPVNGSPVALKRTTTPMTVASESTDVTFGAKVGNLTSGTYTDKVLFTMYVNGQDGKPSDGTESTEPGEDPVITMQNFKCTLLENVNDMMVIADIRDGSEYTVKKLADNKCWMTENLRTINKTISSRDSNLPEGETYTIPTNREASFNDTHNVEAAALDSNYGGYYSFYVATAGWSNDTDRNMNSPKDICPKGWRLPTAGEGGEYNTMTGYYNTSALLQGVPGFARSGFAYGGHVQYKGGIGSFWSGSVIDGSAYYLALYESSYSISGDYSRYDGRSIRCVAK